MTMQSDLNNFKNEINSDALMKVRGVAQRVFHQMHSSAPELTGNLKRNLTIETLPNGASITQTSPNRDYPMIMNLGSSNVNIKSGDEFFFVHGIDFGEDLINEMNNNFGNKLNSIFKTKYNI